MTHCPHCHAPLPQPPERFCPTCGGDLSATPVPPAPGPRAGDGTPWDRRASLGFMPALLETTKKALFEPTRFFAGVSPGVGIGGPLLYALIVGYIGVAAAAVYSALSETLLRSMWGDLFGRGPFGDTPFGALPPWLEGGFGLILKLIFAPVALVIMIFVMAAIFHVILTLLGDTTKGFVTTLQVVCYGEATSLFRVVPGCGGLIAPIYFIVLAIIGLSEAHGVSRAKSAVAVLLPIVLGCCCGVLVGAFIAWGAAGYMRR